jgi:hypothetical protein
MIWGLKFAQERIKVQRSTKEGKTITFVVLVQSIS